MKDPIVTVQKDGEAAFGLSPKRFAKQYAATLADQSSGSINEQKPGRTIYITDEESINSLTDGWADSNQPRMTVPLIQGTLRYAFYKKTKVSACGAPGAAED